MIEKQIHFTVKSEHGEYTASYDKDEFADNMQSNNPFFIEGVKNLINKGTDYRSNYTWQRIALSKTEYVQKASDPDYEKSLVADYTGTDNPNLIGFVNQGGLFNGGVCWWHSRLQRNFLLLSYFTPEKEKPSSANVNRIVKSLMHAECVTEIPGYSSIRDFTAENQNLIQKCLNQTQLIEGLFEFAWINGLAGETKARPQKMKKQMDHLYDSFLHNGISYVKLQAPGIVSHAWLIVDMRKNADGYIVKFIDSNFNSSILSWEYKYGDKCIQSYSGDLGVPYVQRIHEKKKISRIIADSIKENKRGTLIVPEPV